MAWLAAAAVAACGGDDGGKSGSGVDDSGTPTTTTRDAASATGDSGAHASDASSNGNAGSDAGSGGNPGSGASDAGTSSDAGATAGDDAGTLPGWKLVWSDEFNGAKGTQPDSAKWTFEINGNGEGNSELEYYTDSPDNASMDGAGNLQMTAKLQMMGNSKYTSARMNTSGKFEHKYGRYEARIRITKGQGIWPAFWMLGNDIKTASWPTCGEIDIMENIGKEPTLVHGTIHGPGYSGGNGLGKQYELANKAPFADDFHVFAVEWEDSAVRWYVDDALYETRTPADVPKGDKWVYDHPFFIILNVAVGGQWPGNPDNTTKFPETMLVDYVRVYDKSP